jgi:hypothetical protein
MEHILTYNFTHGSMNDLGSTNLKFQNWQSVLDFLAGIEQSQVIEQDLHVTKRKGQDWQVRLHRFDDKELIRKTIKTNSGVGLHDLSW